MSEENPETKRPWYFWPVISGGILIFLLFITPDPWLRSGYYYISGRLFKHTEGSRIASFGKDAEKRLHIGKIPSSLKIVVLKEEKRLELWDVSPDGSANCIKTYRILAASGKAGPKLKEGDLQVPEGDYAVESLHPNSLFYLALRVGYPSAEDIEAAKTDGRDPAGLGSDIMIHGAGGSVGCIAVTNNSIEEIFYLASKVGISNVRLLFCPYDFRDKPLPEKTEPQWLEARYRRLAEELNRLKKQNNPIIQEQK